MTDFFAFLNVYWSLSSLYSSRPYGGLWENPETGHIIIELFLPKNEFRTCSTVNFPKTHPNFGGLETNWRHEIQTQIFFKCASTFELYII